MPNLKRGCDERLAGRCHIDVIDRLMDAELAAGDQMIAIPALVRHLAEPHIQLRLFVAGNSQLSQRAIATLRAFCERSLPPELDLEVVDIYQQPGLAVRDQVVAVPTLLKLLPSPVRRIIGDLSNEHRLLRVFGLHAPSDDDR